MSGRILAENSYSAKQSYFVTFTYNDSHQPAGFEKDFIRNFHKRLRRKLEYYSDAHFRYFFTCEYGDQKGRSHYHAIYLLDTVFPDEMDLEPFTIVGPDGGVFTEPYNEFKQHVRDCWTRDGESLGFVYFGTLTGASAKYCTAYALKEDDWYRDNAFALSEGRIPPENIPFRLFSRRPGLGMDDKTLAAVQWYAYGDPAHPRTSLKFDSESVFPVPAIYRQHLDDEELKEYLAFLGQSRFQGMQEALKTNYERFRKPAYTSSEFGDSQSFGTQPDYTIDNEILNQRREIRILRKNNRKAYYAKKNVPSA